MTELSQDAVEVTFSTEINHRDDFPMLCDWRRLETVVEVGVDRGVFSAHFMRYARYLRHYIGVDPYHATDEFPSNRDGDLHVAASRYAGSPVGTLLRTSGAVLALSITNGQLGHIKEGKVDFVYIDAVHEYAHVKQDIATWWPLISDRGILAGHDYDETHPGVMQAVQEFAAKVGQVVYITREHPNSWYCYKAGLPGPDWKRVE